MAGKHHHQFDLNVNAFESNETQQIIGETSDQRIENGFQDVNLFSDPQPKRKRHTQEQIEQMEAFFNECPNPNSKQRKSLSLGLGLEPLQIKFWFQNKRTQTKTKNYHQENAQLREENKMLKAENTSHKETLENVACVSCGGPMIIREMSMAEHQLHLENAQLREEIERVSAIAAGYVGKPFANRDNGPFSAVP